MALRYTILKDSYTEPVSTPTEEELVGVAEVNNTGAVEEYSPAGVTEPVRADFIDTGSIVPSAALGSTPTISYVVRVGWESTPANAFTLDASQLDGGKELTSSFSSFLNLLQFGISTFGGTDGFADSFSSLYADISADVMSIRTKRGRDDNLSAFDAGEAVVTLHDPDGTYNPMNSSSSLYPYVTPGRPIIIEALLNGERYGIFRGFVRSIEHDPHATAKTSRLICQDLLLYLSRAKPEIAQQSAGLTTGECIGLVLDAVGWTDENLRQLGYGDIVGGTFGPFTGDTSALQIIQDLLVTERGEFYHGRDGVVRYFYRHARAVRESGFLLDGAVAGATPAADLTNVRNKAIVTATGSGTATWSDEPSITNFGPSEVVLESSYLVSSAQAQSLAQWLVTNNKTAQPPLRAVEFVANSDYGRLFVALTMEIGDRIAVADSAVNLDQREFFIEGIEHEISNGGHLQRTSFTLSAVPPQAPLMFGVSRVVGTPSVYSSPTGTASPYTEATTESNIFAY